MPMISKSLGIWRCRPSLIPAGPTVLVNVDSPILQEIVEYHRAQYPDVYAEEVRKTIYQVFGEVAACKIAHSQKLSEKTCRNRSLIATIGANRPSRSH
jgi:hypothetical protein